MFDFAHETINAAKEHVFKGIYTCSEYVCI